MNESQAIGQAKYLKRSSNYDKHPFVRVSDSSHDCKIGWSETGETINAFIASKSGKPTVIAVDTYPGVLYEDVLAHLQKIFQPGLTIDTQDLLLPEKILSDKLQPYLGHHPIFGKLNDLRIKNFFDPDKIRAAKDLLSRNSAEVVLVYGTGSSLLISEPSVLIYADMARWEIQQRMRRHEVDNLGFSNRTKSPGLLYKQAYFVDWRVADQL